MKELGKISLVVVGVAIFAVSLGIVGYYVGIFGNHVQANFQKRVVTSQVEQKVRTADFAQATYEQFFNDCNAVIADGQKIEIAKDRLAAIEAQPDDVFGTKAGKVADAESDLAGVRQAQADTAARYNAGASEYTRGQFLSNELPASIDAPYDNLRCR